MSKMPLHPRLHSQRSGVSTTARIQEGEATSEGVNRAMLRWPVSLPRLPVLILHFGSPASHASEAMHSVQSVLR
jgi:hypothetical protein